MSNFISEFFDDVGDTLSDAWHAVEANPIGVLVTIGGAMYGLPPIYAGALGGAAGTAAAGGSTNQIIKGALTGGALAYIGGEASSAAGGGIAGAAAGGAATGAALTAINGGNLKSNIWNGLVIGTTVGGLQQIMTTQEAISSVPKDVMAAANASADPMGTLIDRMGWTPGNGAISAAGQAVDKYQTEQRDANLSLEQKAYNKTQTDMNMNDAYNNPDIEKFVYEARMSNDPAATLAQKLGYTSTELTNTTVTDAMNKVLLDPSMTGYNPTQISSQAQSLVNTGLVNNAEAVALTDSGYTAQDIQDLVKVGYNAADLADMASTGVPASTLKSLANTQFSENTINDLLTKGNVSANEIAQASNLVNSGKLNITTAESLLNHGVNSLDLPGIANSGKADQIAKLMDSGVSKNNAQYMLDKGVDLSKANQMIDSGKFTGQQINDSFSNNTYNDTINKINSYTSAPVSPTTTPTVGQGPVAPTNPYDTFAKDWNPLTGDPTTEADLYGTKYSQDQAAAREANMTSAQKATMESRLSLLGGTPEQLEAAASSGDYNSFLKKMGWSTDNAYTREAYQRGLDSYTGQQNALKQYTIETNNLANVPDTAIKTIDSSGKISYFDSATGNVYDTNGTVVSGPVTPSAPITQTAEYTPQQEQLYKQYISEGMTPAQAVERLGTVSDTTPTKIDVGGSAGYAGNPSSVVQEYRTPNTDLATQAQIDNGSASYNAGANAWEVPTQAAPEIPEKPYVPVPITPVVTPPTPTPTQPTTVTPVTPQVPVTPSQPTLTYSNNVNGNNTTYKVDHYSDGRVVYTDMNNNGTGSTADEATRNGTYIPSGGGTTGTGTTGGTITPVTPQEPLTPPTQEVIPETPKIPEVTPEQPTTPEEPTTPTEPTTPEQPYIPVPPEVIPTPPETPAEGTYNLHWGKVPYLGGHVGLNPGLIRAVPHYTNTGPAQSEYYWGQHPFQPGTTFDPKLYNQVPYAPAEPFGVKEAARAATANEILAKMGSYYPLTVSGPVTP